MYFGNAHNRSNKPDKPHFMIMFVLSSIELMFFLALFVMIIIIILIRTSSPEDKGPTKTRLVISSLAMFSFAFPIIFWTWMITWKMVRNFGILYKSKPVKQESNKYINYFSNDTRMSQISNNPRRQVSNNCPDQTLDTLPPSPTRI